MGEREAAQAQAGQLLEVGGHEAGREGGQRATPNGEGFKAGQSL